MKKIIVIFAVFLSFCAFGKSSKKEVRVSFEKTKKNVIYRIKIDKPFEMNLEAPFKFYLQDANKKIIKKVKFNEFKKNKNSVLEYVSNSGEKNLKYWFIACKHIKGKIVACKTFTGKLSIK